jgi:transcriptional regulator with XRE-family HTH domain
MRKSFSSEKLMIEEVSHLAESLKHTMRGLPIGDFIKRIRCQLGMSQEVLANRSGLPQPTVSRIEKGQKDPSLSRLSKLLAALSCDLVVAPVLKQSIDSIRYQQARLIAEKHVQYLMGTMNLEKQKPDKKLREDLIKKEVDEILHGSGVMKLWKE